MRIKTNQQALLMAGYYLHWDDNGLVRDTRRGERFHAIPYDKKSYTLHYDVTEHGLHKSYYHNFTLERERLRIIRLWRAYKPVPPAKKVSKYEIFAPNLMELQKQKHE